MYLVLLAAPAGGAARVLVLVLGSFRFSPGCDHLVEHEHEHEHAGLVALACVGELVCKLLLARLALRYTALVQLAARIAVGFASSAAVALFALRRGSLSRSGALGALGIGTSIFAGGGPLWFSALLAFFVSSSALGKLGAARKAALKAEFEKGDTRDAYQALANGGVAALCALGMLGAPHPLWLGAFVGALATANGDTWATEIGTLSRGEPISLLSLKRVPRGSSGAVSPLGVLATAAGGGLVGTLIATGEPPGSALGIALLGVAAGVAGSLADSLLGATLQASYYCTPCARRTEGRLHQCGRAAEHAGGFAWFDNDLVNLSATALGAGLGALWLWIAAF